MQVKQSAAKSQTERCGPQYLAAYTGRSEKFMEGFVIEHRGLTVTIRNTPRLLQYPNDCCMENGSESVRYPLPCASPTFGIIADSVSIIANPNPQDNGRSFSGVLDKYARRPLSSTPRSLCCLSSIVPHDPRQRKRRDITCKSLAIYPKVL